MISCVFDSVYGYSSLIRVGRIYFFPSLVWVQYLLEANEDLVYISPVLKRFLRVVKEKYDYEQKMKNISLRYIRDKELGYSNKI